MKQILSKFAALPYSGVGSAIVMGLALLFLTWAVLVAVIEVFLWICILYVIMVSKYFRERPFWRHWFMGSVLFVICAVAFSIFTRTTQGINLLQYDMFRAAYATMLIGVVGIHLKKWIKPELHKVDE